MEVSRIQNSQRNLYISILSQVITLILSFVSRTVFVKTLGMDYLGVNGLFTNIISVLSLAELGVGTAIVYSMYKPLAEHDTKKLAALTQYYSTLYKMIAIIILLVGIAIFPFLDIIINLDTSIPNVKYYYLLFLGEAVTSYLIIYKTSIITADQKGYIVTRNRMIANIIASVLQILVLVSIKNYVIYLLIRILIPLAGNYYSSRVASKLYPFIDSKETLSKEERKSIWNNIKSMFLYRVGGVILNNTDNILISTLINTTLVGKYSNYSMLITRVTGFTSLIFSSVQASLGNLNVDANEEKKYKIFNILSLLSFWVYAFCSICFCMLFQDFIAIWLGTDYQLSLDVVYIAVLNFYFEGVLYPIWCYRQTTGLFHETKYTMLIASAINLILSILLGKQMGLFGIFAATAISRLCTNLWFDPYVLFKKYFNASPKKYFIKQLLYILTIIMLITIGQCLFCYLSISNIYFRFIVKIGYCILVPNLFFSFMFFKTEEFRYILDHFILPIFKSRKRRL